MAKRKNNSPCIRLRGVRHNNLKGFDLDLPLNRLIVITGLSGSGKSSLAFDTLYAEGQRRYIETFSPYTRQFFDRMDKPQVDSIEGIPPAIAIEQRNAVKTTRSTVGTMTEICEHMKQVWPLISTLYCRNCAEPVSKETPQRVWELVGNGASTRRAQEVLVTFDLPVSKKLSLKESLNLIEKQGYQRLLISDQGSIEARQKNRTGVPPVACAIREIQTPENVTEAIELHEATAREYRTAAERSRTGGTPVLRRQILRLEDALEYFAKQSPPALTVVQDRIRVELNNRARFIEACEQAYHFGNGRLTVRWLGERQEDGGLLIGREQHFSKKFHCATCDIEYREPSPALFSFNHPIGACATCKGFGRVIQIDYNLAIPDRSLTLNEGAIKPWRTGTGAESQEDMKKFIRKNKIPMDVPFRDLPEAAQRWIIDGDVDYGKDAKHQWPKAWYGVKGYFRWLESKAYKMHVRVLLSKYRTYTLCPDCSGSRLQADALLYRINANGSEVTLPGFYQRSVNDALAAIDSLIAFHKPKPHEPLGLVLGEVRNRLFYLVEIGLGYLTLDRPTRSLSGGETERVNLTTCLGSRLVNTLYVLDEPSVGLHPRDTARLVKIIEGLRDAGNTVVVVEHEEGVMRAADQIVDLGPGHGESGGELVFQGDFKNILKAKGTLTGDYLSGRKTIEVRERRKVGQVSNLSPDGGKRPPTSVKSESCRPLKDRLEACPTLKITGASKHNLQNLSVEIPLQRFVCITGVSGSGKTTLVRDVLLPALAEKLGQTEEIPAGRDKDSDTDEKESTGRVTGTDLHGFEMIERLVLVDQSPIGRTPRSNPAVYIGAFDDIREIFAQTDHAKRLGFNSSSFSFNSAQGQCDRCRGAGFEKVEMQFLSDVFIKCPACGGRRYRAHILEVKVSSDSVFSGTVNSMEVVSESVVGKKRSRDRGKTDLLKTGRSIADVLESSVDDVINWLREFTDSRPAQKAAAKLELLQEVGLGYMRLGQPINTLSGGECQRLKLVSHLASVVGAQRTADEKSTGKTAGRSSEKNGGNKTAQNNQSILFVFDEPTTGLHFEDVRVLLLALQRLVDAGHSVVVIEHHLDVIRCADWVIDLGPGAGDEGGQVVVAGTPDDVARCDQSFTGQALKARH